MKSVWDFVALILLLIVIAQIILASYFTIQDLRKNKFGIGLGIYWCLLFITAGTVLIRGRQSEDFWLAARVLFFLLTGIYFFCYLAFRIIRDKKTEN